MVMVYSMRLSGNGTFSLTIFSLLKEFKCATVRLDMPLRESWDPAVRGPAPTLATGIKKSSAAAVMDAKSSLYHWDIVCHVQQSRGGLGLGTKTSTWKPNAKHCWNTSSFNKRRNLQHKPDRTARWGGRVLRRGNSHGAGSGAWNQIAWASSKARMFCPLQQI